MTWDQVEDDVNAAVIDAFKRKANAIYNGGVSIEGVFFNAFQETGDAQFSVFNSSNPVFVCQVEDVSSAPRNDTLTIDSTVYTIVNHQPDGTGLVSLELRTA